MIPSSLDRPVQGAPCNLNSQQFLKFPSLTIPLGPNRLVMTVLTIHFTSSVALINLSLSWGNVVLIVTSRQL